jgi:DNA mismatch endonuclease (patch repair protein)
MRANRRRDTGPERRIRSLLHQRGLRYRVDYRVGHRRGAPRPDIAFTRLKLAVFIDGCFWHGCPEHGRVPATNGAYWGPKLARNAERLPELVSSGRITSLGEWLSGLDGG